MKITLVLLTLNEIDGLRSLFHLLPLNQADEVFAVDGGSTDGTIDFLNTKQVRIVDQDVPGRGEAMRIGTEEANGDAVIFFSPDGNEDPLDIPKFRPLLQNGNDLVIASRMLPNSVNEEDTNHFRWRKWANQIFTCIANAYCNRGKSGLSDAINGYRAIRKDLFQTLDLDSTGYTIEYQMSIRALKANMNIVEFPTVEKPRIGGESYAKSIPTGIAMLKTLFREIIS